MRYQLKKNKKPHSLALKISGIQKERERKRIRTFIPNRAAMRAPAVRPIVAILTLKSNPNKLFRFASRINSMISSVCLTFAYFHHPFDHQYDIK